MNKLASDIFRQRLLIEGYYQISVDKQVIENYFTGICNDLGLKMYGEPIIFSPAGIGKDENQGYDAFVPLIDSGISLYVWSNKKFVSLIIYTCKGFDSQKAVEFTKSYFNIEQITHDEF